MKGSKKAKTPAKALVKTTEEPSELFFISNAPSTKIEAIKVASEDEIENDSQSESEAQSEADDGQSEAEDSQSEAESEVDEDQSGEEEEPEEKKPSREEVLRAPKYTEHKEK